MKQIFTLLFLSVSMFLGAQNILQNGSFENWTDGKPDSWFGSKTNIAASSVVESSEAQDGSKSVALINTGSSHKRFTTEGYDLTPNTSYTLTFYIKGVGDVRNAFYNGNDDSTGQGYSAYSAYTAATDSWEPVTYTFETSEDVTGVQIIISVRNTGEEGVLIDNAMMTEGGEIEITEVSTIAELRAGETGSQIYKLTGDALLTYMIANRNQKYIQDDTAGILIDDAAGRLGNEYEIGDALTNITGSLTVFNGLLQFVPTEEGADVSSTGNEVNYQIVSLSDYLDNPTAYESEYIAINGLTISDIEGGDGTFQNGKSYPMTDGTNDVIGRTQFFNIEIIGQNIPSEPVAVIGFGGRFNDDIQVFMSDVTDLLGTIEVSTSNVNLTTVWTNEAVVSAKGNAMVEIYNMNGQLVQRANGSNTFTINVSSLTKGVYVVKVTVDGKVTVRKAVKK
ncbi:MAG: T9SS type A sorting domain-containing protein [Weeksellaceae bacterium]